MKLNSRDLEKIADLTLDYYNQHAEDFWEGTRDHDVSQNIEAMLQYIEGERPFTILDFGCGPGRDLKVFAELGHITIGLEGIMASTAARPTQRVLERFRRPMRAKKLLKTHEPLRQPSKRTGGHW